MLAGFGRGTNLIRVLGVRCGQNYGAHLRISQHAREISPAGQRRELIRIQGVDRDVDRGQSLARERLGKLGEQVAVRGHRDLFDPGDPAHAPDQLDDALAHRRLAAGQPHLADAELCEHADHALELLERQDG